MNKNTLIGVLVAIIVVLGGYFILRANPQTPAAQDQGTGSSQTQPVTVLQNNPTASSAGQGTSTTSSPLSTTLPTPYIGGQQNWPPVIQDSSAPYSCTPIASHDGMAGTVQKVIGSRTYCVTSSGDSFAGGTGYTYTYTTASLNGSGTETTTFTLIYHDCGVYGNPQDPQSQAGQCQADEQNFNVDAIVSSLM